MTEDERRMAIALGGCKFPPASPPKRFARDMAAEAAFDDAVITEGQAEWLRVLVQRYRRQLPDDVVALARQVRS